MRGRSTAIFLRVRLQFFVALSGILPVLLPAQVVFPVSIEGTPGADEELEAAIRSNLVGAAKHWSRHLDGPSASIEIVLRIAHDAPNGLGSGNSVTVAKVGEAGKKDVYEQGMAYEIRTGQDPNGTEPDVLIVLHPDYLSTLWFDPDPLHRTVPVPRHKLDAVSVLLHELGHAIAFNGWLSFDDGPRDDGAISTYDCHVRVSGSNFVFAGPRAMRLYGDVVPLSRTRNNYHHVGDAVRGPDDPLARDLMNGVTLEFGRRYSISELDLAMVADARLAVETVQAKSSGSRRPGNRTATESRSEPDSRPRDADSAPRCVHMPEAVRRIKRK